MGSIQIHNAERDALQIPDRQAYEHYPEPLGDFGVYNGQFEQGPDGRYPGAEGWNLLPDPGGTVDRVASGLAGNYRIRGGRAGMGTGGDIENWKYLAVDQTKDYMLSASFIGTVNARVRMGLHCYSAAKALLGSIFPLANTIPGVAWVRYERVVGPGGTAFINLTRYVRIVIELQNDAALTAEYAYVDDVHFRWPFAVLAHAPHDPVTLSIDLQANLLGLAVQQLTLDNQAANVVFAGPAAGGAAAPAFRALVVADIPALTEHWTVGAGRIWTTVIDKDVVPNTGTGTIGQAADRWARINAVIGSFTGLITAHVGIDSIGRIQMSPGVKVQWIANEYIRGFTGNLSLNADSGDAISFLIGNGVQLLVEDGVFRPNVPNDIDLGAAAKRFKVLYGINANFSNDVILANGSTVGIAAGPLINFDSTGGDMSVMAANFGVGTLVPGQIFDVNQGSGNMIADGYDLHSLAAYKEDLRAINPSAALMNLVATPPRQWTRMPFISPVELIDDLAAEFAEVKHADKGHHERLAQLGAPGGNKVQLRWVNERREQLRRARKTLPEWQRIHYGLVADDPATAENLPELISRHEETGEIRGYSLGSYAGLLHAAVIELHQRVSVLEG